RLPNSIVNAPPIKWNEIQKLATRVTLIEYSIIREWKFEEGKWNEWSILYIWIIGKSGEIHFEKVDIDKDPNLVDTKHNLKDLVNSIRDKIPGARKRNAESEISTLPRHGKAKVEMLNEP